MNHLFGVYLSKKHESYLLDNYQDCLLPGREKMDDKPAAMKDKARAKMIKYQRKFKEFIESSQE